MATTSVLRVGGVDYNIRDASLINKIINLDSTVTVIENGTDYNTLTAYGTYRVETISAAQSMVHCPTQNPHKLIVGRVVGGGDIKQIVVVSPRSEFIVRSTSNSGSTWTDWEKVVLWSDVDEAVKEYSIITSTASDEIPNNTDYNSLTTPGNYKCSTISASDTMTHCPARGPHRLIVMKQAVSNQILQIATYAYNNQIFTRIYNADNWLDWEKIAYDSELATKVDLLYSHSIISDGSDYDNIGVGAYTCPSSSAAQTMIHCPVTVSHRLLCFETYNSSNIMQIIMTNRQFYFRYKGETWQTYQVAHDDFPAYYNNYILDRENVIRNRIMNSGFRSDSFALITDIHWGPRNEKHSPGLLKHIAQNTSLVKLIMLGDYFATDIIERAAKNLTTVLNSYKGIGFERYIAVGNHDYNQSTIPGIETFEESELYPLVMTMQDNDYHIMFDDDTCSFAVDNPNKKLLYFFTNCNVSSSFDPDSYKWVFDKMQEVPDGYDIAIFTHSGLNGPGDTGHRYAQHLTGALRAFKNRTTYTFDGSTFDYSEVDAGVLFVYGGHNHADQTFVDRGIMCIVTTCDAAGLEEGGITRTVGTIYEQAFECASLGATAGKLWLTRIGGGVDRIINYNPVEVSTSVTLTSELSGTLTWAVEDSNVISVSNGVVTKVASGSWSAVYAYAEDGTTEVWNIVT